MTRTCQLSLLALLATVPLAAQPTMAYDFGSPSSEAVEMLAIINRARADPEAEGIRLAATSDPQVVNAYNYFSVDLDKVRTDFASYPGRPPLAWHKGLIQAALNQSNYQISIDSQTHDRPPGQTFGSSFTDAGYGGYNGIAENIYAYSRSIWHSHAGLNVDWGGPDVNNDGVQDHMGHRKTLMDYEDKGYIYREIGIAVVPENNTDTSLGPLVITQDYGMKWGTSFLVGTVYIDANHNGVYDPGEGQGGVTIMPDQGDYYATTSSSGAYTIPLEGRTGALTISSSPNTTAEVIELTIVLTPENRRVDIVDGAFRDHGAFGGFFDFDRGADAGWSRSAWMGWLIDSPSGWIYHGLHGWLFPMRSAGSQSMPIYDRSLGWMWTSEDLYPYFYHYGSGRWLFYQEPSEYPDRWFYAYGDGGGWFQEFEPVP